MDAYSVLLSPVAEKKLLLLLDFLENEWGEKSKKEFLKHLQKSVKTISRNPKAFEESKSFQNLYKCVITKHAAIYYRIHKKKLK